MNQLPDSLALLRNANPVQANPTAVDSAQATAMFEQIVSEPRNAHGRLRRIAGRLVGGRGARARLAVGGAGITAVAAAIVVVAISGSAAQPAFAGWSTTPTSALPEQTTAAAHRCGLAGRVLVEARGPYTAAVFASRAGGSACVEGPSLSFVASVGGAQAADNRFKPDQIGTAVATGSDHTGHAFVLLAGRVGSAVRSIVIHRSNHTDVVASIKDGWYLAWWPARAHATNATVTTTSGAHDVALPALATSDAAPCSGPPHSSCAATQVGSNGPGSAGVPGPPLISGQLIQPFDRTLLLNVSNASKVLVCFHPPGNAIAALRRHGPTGPCTHAALLTRLPPGYRGQRNLLEIFPNAIWQVKLPVGARDNGKLLMLVVATGTGRWGQMRNEITLNP
jgi:hypothetical protein